MAVGKAFYESGLSFNNVRELIEYVGTHHAELVAFDYLRGKEDIRITYKQFENDVKKMSVYINKHYQNEKRIGVVCSLTYECIIVIYGIMTSGKAAVLLDSVIENPKLETEVILNPDNKEIMLGKARDIDSDEWDNNVLNPQDECAVFMTSGTTGTRKVVAMTQEQVLISFDGAAFHKVIFTHPRTLYVLPLYHMLGSITLICLIGFGCHICLNQSIKYFQRDIKKYKPQIMECVPLMLEYIYKAVNTQLEKTGKKGNFKKLIKITNCLRKIHIDIRRIVYKPIINELGGELFAMACGGAALNKEVLNFFESIGIDIYEGYGMTETSTFATVNTDKARRVGSVGVAAPYNEIRIKDGEVQIKGKNVFDGYYLDEEASRDIFDGEWLCTGDLGYMDQDGFLYITGRKKNIIIRSNGENVIPEEIENELLKSDMIDEVIVYEKGQHIHATIYSEKYEIFGEEELYCRMKDEIDKVNSHNSKAYYVDEFDLKKEPFEKTITMKIKRNCLH